MFEEDTPLTTVGGIDVYIIWFPDNVFVNLYQPDLIFQEERILDVLTAKDSAAEEAELEEKIQKGNKEKERVSWVLIYTSYKLRIAY